MALLKVWKPRGPTSHFFLRGLETNLKESSPELAAHKRLSLGHTGTLDPFAEGVLVVGVNEGTKLLTPLMGLPKTYEVTLELGVSSDSFDDTGVEARPSVTDAPGVEEKLAALVLQPASFFAKFLEQKLGHFMQTPPPQSARRVDGKRAYEWAHKGVMKELPAKEMELLRARHLTTVPGTPFFWNFEVTVSTGTYIRSFARDWGVELTGFPGRLTRLVRRAVGPFEMLDESPSVVALGMKDLKAQFDTLTVSEFEAVSLRKHGRFVPVPGVKAALVLSPLGEPVAWLQPETGAVGRVFNNDPLPSLIAGQELIREKRI